MKIFLNIIQVYHSAPCIIRSIYKLTVIYCWWRKFMATLPLVDVSFSSSQLVELIIRGTLIVGEDTRNVKDGCWPFTFIWLEPTKSCNDILDLASVDSRLRLHIQQNLVLVSIDVHQPYWYLSVCVYKPRIWNM